MGPVMGKSPTKDGRDRLDVTYEHVRECCCTLNEVQREAAPYLGVPPQRPPSLIARARSRRR